MRENIKIIILTKSSKHHGYCVAGVDAKTGKWIRLVSSDINTHGALSACHLKYKDGTYCRPLDIVSVPIIKRCPTVLQPENILIDEKAQWTKIGRASLGELINTHMLESHVYLLGNAYPYITSAKIGTVGHSLELVYVKNMIIYHPQEQRTKACFDSLNGITYKDMSVTDRDFYDMPNNTMIGDALIVVSLPDTPIMENRYYKFVAKIFPINKK